MYQFHYRLLPHNFENFFQNINQVHKHVIQSYTLFLSVEQILDNFLSATKALNFLTLSLRISVKLHPFLVFGKNFKNIVLFCNILSSNPYHLISILVLIIPINIIQLLNLSFFSNFEQSVLYYTN